MKNPKFPSWSSYKVFTLRVDAIVSLYRGRRGAQPNERKRERRPNNQTHTHIGRQAIAASCLVLLLPRTTPEPSGNCFLAVQATSDVVPSLSYTLGFALVVYSGVDRWVNRHRDGERGFSLFWQFPLPDVQFYQYLSSKTIECNLEVIFLYICYTFCFQLHHQRGELALATTNVF